MSIFYDAENNAATLVGVFISETAGFVLTTQISGVYYYALNSQFTIDINDIDFINSESFPLNQVTAVGAEYGLPQLDIPGSSLTGWTNSYDNINASYQKTDWAITAVLCTVNNTANISARTEDWSSGAWVNSANDSICVFSLSDTSTAFYESFRRETRRLTSAWGAWDNTQDLNAYDDNLGLQYQCDRLVYPSVNFTTYDPLPGSQPNYSASAGTRTLFLDFNDSGVSHSNGIFSFADHNIVETDITGGNFDIDISLDGVNWYDCNSGYLGGALSDGDGCRIDTGVYSITANNSIRFTLGIGGATLVGTGPSSWGIFLRFRWAPAMAGKYLGTFSISDW